ncbi:MAG: hypothetical protein JW787_06385 [Sedimentisphaerales bacterium]|nr:hypothetical protein [Sedimentisphaerales bacterium]
MNDQRILEELLSLLEANGVKIREEPLGGSGGGLCMMKGENLFFKDTQAPASLMAVMCAKAIVKVVDIEQIYIRPEIREFIENYGDI